MKNAHIRVSRKVSANDKTESPLLKVILDGVLHEFKSEVYNQRCITNWKDATRLIEGFENKLLRRINSGVINTFDKFTGKIPFAIPETSLSKIVFQDYLINIINLDLQEKVNEINVEFISGFLHVIDSIEDKLLVRNELESKRLEKGKNYTDVFLLPIDEVNIFCLMEP